MAAESNFLTVLVTEIFNPTYFWAQVLTGKYRPPELHAYDQLTQLGFISVAEERDDFVKFEDAIHQYASGSVEKTKVNVGNLQREQIVLALCNKRWTRAMISRIDQ